MSQAEELLNSLDTARSVSRLANASEEPHIVIGSDRYITVPEELKRLAVQYDHDIETVTFDCPRYWDEIDMSTMAIYINYRCPDDTLGSYKAQNVTVDSDDESIMHFDWTISKNVTMEAGKLTFIVCIRNTDTDGNEVNHWNSELYSDCIISEGLEFEGEILKGLYPDIVDQYLQAALEAGFRGEKGDKGDQGVGIVSIELEVDEDYIHTHVWDNGVITSPSTCTMPGTMTYTCTMCGETKTGSIPTSAHAWNTGKIVIEATCTTAGEKTCTCSKCGTSETKIIPALGHKVVTVPGHNATCTTDGLSDGSHCSRCGTVLAAQETIPAFGHSMNNGVCERCGYTTPTSYYTEIQFNNVSVYKSELNPDISPVLVINVTSTGFTVLDNNTAKQVYEYTYSGSEQFTGLATSADGTTAAYAVGAAFTVGGTSDNSINKFYTVKTTTYTTSITLIHGDDDRVTTVFEEAANGHSPSVEMTIYADRLVFRGETTESDYTLPADSTGISGLSHLYDQALPDDGYEVGATQTISGKEGENKHIVLYPVYAQSGSTTYTTTIKVNGANYWTSPTATENSSPEITITVGKNTSGKLYFTYSYQGTQVGMYSAESTDVAAFKYNGTEYTSGQSFTIGGETGQNTIANIYTLTNTTPAAPTIEINGNTLTIMDSQTEVYQFLIDVDREVKTTIDKTSVATQYDLTELDLVDGTYSITVRGRYSANHATKSSNAVTYTVTKETTTYTIRTKLTNVSGASSNPTTIAENGTATLNFTADFGYSLPASVTVTGATYDWNNGIGMLTLSNPTGNVVVTVIASDVSEVTPIL